MTAWDPADFRARVQTVLDEFIDAQAAPLDALGADAERLLAEGEYPALATHDDRIIERLLASSPPRERFELQMLYGVRRELQDGLVGRGYNVRVYVPYGKTWYPYFMRRLAERPANVWFVLKNFFKG